MNAFRIASLSLFLVGCIVSTEGTFAEDAYLECTDGVEVISMGGSRPGYMTIADPKAFAIVVSNDVALAAGGVLGDENGGRFVTFAHGSFINGADDDESGHGIAKLLLNTIKWTGKKSTPHVALKSGASEQTNLQEIFTAENFTFSTLSDTEVVSGGLSEFDVLLAHAEHYTTTEELQALRTFLESGKGIIFYGTSWAYLYPDYFYDELIYPPNIVLKETGVYMMGSINWDADLSPWTVSETFPDPVAINAGEAVERLIASVNDENGTLMTIAEEEIAFETIEAVTNDILDSRSGQTTFFAQLNILTDLVKAKYSVAYPSATSPLVRADVDPQVTFIIMLENDFNHNLPALELEAHPTHVDFPGPVPSSAETITRRVTVNGNYDGLDRNLIYAGSGADKWHSTGLYLPAGKVANVTVDSGMVDFGLRIQVGCHSDNVRNKDELLRMPRIARSWPITSEFTQVGTAYGGLVYVEVPWGATLGELNVTITGAVESLLYVHGKTSIEEWNALIARDDFPPFGELMSDKYVLSLPIAALRNLADPVTIMNYWDSVVDAEDYLLGYPLLDWRATNGRAERFVVDIQISNGWMHSGYPIMAYFSVAERQLDIDHLLSDGEWGPYHELGHNHQWRAFVVPGSTEVSCNFFSAFITEKINEEPLSGVEDFCPNHYRQYLKAPSYETILGDVWLHLGFFLGYKNAFGWGAMKNVLTEYSQGDGSLDDLSSEERIDPLMIKLSEEAGYSIVNWADAWNYPITNETRNRLKVLPDWDFDATLDAFDEQLASVTECYPAPDQKNLAIHYNDPELPETMWMHSPYRGSVNITEGGYTCQRWDQQTPNTHSYTAENYPCGGLEDNCCRMQGEDRPWCYTVDGPRWQYCDVPECDTAPTASPSPSPSVSPTTSPTSSPTAMPSSAPTSHPTVAPTDAPSLSPTSSPSAMPTLAPTTSPSAHPTTAPTDVSIPEHSQLWNVDSFTSFSNTGYYSRRFGLAMNTNIGVTYCSNLKNSFRNMILWGMIKPEADMVFGVTSVDLKFHGAQVLASQLFTFLNLTTGHNEFYYTQNLFEDTDYIKVLSGPPKRWLSGFMRKSQVQYGFQLHFETPFLDSNTGEEFSISPGDSYNLKLGVYEDFPDGELRSRSCVDYDGTNLIYSSATSELSNGHEASVAGSVLAYSEDLQRLRAHVIQQQDRIDSINKKISEKDAEIALLKTK